MSAVDNHVPSMDALRTWRQRLKISQERVAARLDLSAKTIGRWEAGHDPGELSRRRLANLYAAAEHNPDEWAA